MLTACCFLLTGFIVCRLSAGEGGKRVWTFDDDEPGVIAKGFTNEVGEWKVVDSAEGKVLAQSAKNPNSVFNVALVSDTNVKDVDISVRMKAIAGEYDQGGGLVWRAKDAKNYYVARNNPLGAGSYQRLQGRRWQAVDDPGRAHQAHRRLAHPPGDDDRRPHRVLPRRQEVPRRPTTRPSPKRARSASGRSRMRSPTSMT